MKSLKHHTKRLFSITPMFVHGMFIGACVGVVVVVGLRATLAHAVSIVSSRDCDSNAVISCGALSTSELKQHYRDKGVATIYSHFGIKDKDIKDIDKTAVAGLVHKNGTVTVGGDTVATDAITAGRENVSGSTRVSSDDVTFYKRKTSASFRPNSIPAFVVMDKGKFKYAIVGSCGVPVVATPVPEGTPPPVVPEPPITSAPPVVPETVSTQTPESVPIVTASVTTPVAQLPNTGPGAVIIIAVLSVLGGYLFHATHRHVRRKRRLRHAASHHQHHPRHTS